MDTNQLAITIHHLNEGGKLDHLLKEITKDIALEIVSTQPQDDSERERLYMLTQALKRLEDKLQEYANIYTIELTE